MPHFVRDIFTGELVERLSEGGGVHVIARETPKFGVGHGRRAIRRAWQGGHISRPLSLKPEECTPERISTENEAAIRHGTGAYFTPDGLCHLETRGQRRRELRRQRRIDADGGYGD